MPNCAAFFSHMSGSPVDQHAGTVRGKVLVRLVLRSRPGFEWDTGLFTSVGLDLRDAALVSVKSASHFRVGFAPHAARVLIAETPGATCVNMRRLVLPNATRTLWPLDEIAA